MIKLTLDEIAAERLEFVPQMKVFVSSIIMIPIAFIAHVITSTVSVFSIPNKVVDIITLAEKTKSILRKKQNVKND